MAKVVGGELEVVAGGGAAGWGGHYAGVEDEEVETVVLGGEGLGGGFDGFEGGEVQRKVFDGCCGKGVFWELGFDVFDGGEGFAFASAGHANALGVVFG